MVASDPCDRDGLGDYRRYRSRGTLALGLAGVCVAHARRLVVGGAGRVALDWFGGNHRCSGNTLGVAGARRMVTTRHLHVQVEMWRAVLALIHAGRDVDMRGMGPVDVARRELKGVFFRNQMFVVADGAVRKEMRQLIEQADDDALRFVQRPEFSHLYRLQTLVEAQIRLQPGWVRTLQWVTSDVWYQLWRRRRLR